VIDIPDEFAAWTVAREGPAGRIWIDSLPLMVASYLERWSLTMEGPIWHGYMAVVVPVRRADGGRAVLKVCWLNGESRGETRALAAWAGRGAVRLIERDDAVGVMLLERLDESRSVRELDGESAARIAGEVCQRLSIPADAVELPRVAELAAGWVTQLPLDWNRLGRPFERNLLDDAVTTCRDFGPEQPDLLLHGDLVFDNILRGDREPWLAIDPFGLIGEPAYDASSLLTNRWSELASKPDLRIAVLRRVAAFAEGAGAETQRTRRWAQARMTNDALWCLEHQPDVADYVVKVAELLV
jgi:streptomycin 6-kinase